MNINQYSALNKGFSTIAAQDLTNKSDRTLLYGYDVDRNTWHTYLKDGKIYTVKYYTPEGDVTEVSVHCNEHYVPNKRLYPARCDYEFCNLLLAKAVNLPFTTFEEVLLIGKYYGKTL